MADVGLHPYTCCLPCSHSNEYLAHWCGCPCSCSQGIDFDNLAGPSGTSGIASNQQLQYDDIDEDPSAAGLLAELDRKSAARKLALPTNDVEVKRRLRYYGQPICCFGEKREDRRERLRAVIIKQRQSQGLDTGTLENGGSDDGSNDDGEDDSEDNNEDEKEKEEEFYTEGDDNLESARRWITAYSLPRAKKRILQQRSEANTPLGRILDVRKSVYSEIKVSAHIQGGNEESRYPGCAFGVYRTVSDFVYSLHRSRPTHH